MKTFNNFSDDLPKVTTDLTFLESFSLPDGKKLPPSYIDFANTCGYGRLCDMFIMYVPMEIDYPDSLQEQINYLQGAIRYSMAEGLTEYEPDGDEGLLARAIPFAMGENGDYLFWDALATVDGEYPIYVLGSHMEGIRFGASNLYELVENLTNEPTVKSVMGPSCAALPRTFEPLALWFGDS